MAKSYYEKLKDPRWQKKRLEVQESRGWACEMCFSDSQELHVHHKHYMKGREPWEYENDQLAVLCRDCHEWSHENDVMAEVISRLAVEGPWGRTDAAYLLAGFCSIDIPEGNKGQEILRKVGQAGLTQYFKRLADEHSGEKG